MTTIQQLKDTEIEDGVSVYEMLIRIIEKRLVPQVRISHLRKEFGVYYHHLEIFAKNQGYDIEPNSRNMIGMTKCEYPNDTNRLVAEALIKVFDESNPRLEDGYVVEENNYIYDDGTGDVFYNAYDHLYDDDVVAEEEQYVPDFIQEFMDDDELDEQNEKNLEKAYKLEEEICSLKTLEEIMPLVKEIDSFDLYRACFDEEMDGINESINWNIDSLFDYSFSKSRWKKSTNIDRRRDIVDEILCENIVYRIFIEEDSYTKLRYIEEFKYLNEVESIKALAEFNTFSDLKSEMSDPSERGGGC